MNLAPSLRPTWQNPWVRRLTKGALIPLAVLFVLIEIVDSFVMPSLTRHGREVPSPELVGQTLESAQKLLADVGASMEIAERRYSPDQPDGIIIEQRPVAGAPIKQGRIFRVVISRGSELVVIPRVRGFTQRQAELILEEAGFVIGQHAPAVDSSLPVGTVVGTVPSAGGRLPRQSVVNLLVNEQARPEYTWCPNLVDMNIEEARDLLRERGLLVGTIDRRHDPTHAAGTILEQSQAAGEAGPQGTEVNLVIAWGR